VKKLFFKISCKLLRLFSEDKKEVDSAIEYYNKKVSCKNRQTQLDVNVRPRTETYEWLTCKSQRELYLKGKSIRGTSFTHSMRHTDHLEAIDYHNS
jgi:hypothetical protein